MPMLGARKPPWSLAMYKPHSCVLASALSCQPAGRKAKPTGCSFWRKQLRKQLNQGEWQPPSKHSVWKQTRVSLQNLTTFFSLWWKWSWAMNQNCAHTRQVFYWAIYTLRHTSSYWNCYSFYFSHLIQKLPQSYCSQAKHDLAILF